MSTFRRSGYHHGDLRQVLLALAREHLESEGLEALSLRALAQEAGVSPMAPYRHFPNREALVEALAQWGFTELRARMLAANHDDPLVALPEFAAAYVEFAREHPSMFGLMYGAGIPTPGVRDGAPDAGVIGLVSQRLAEVIAPDRLEDARLAGWSLMHGLASLVANSRIRKPPENPSDTARRFAAILLRGLTG